MEIVKAVIAIKADPFKSHFGHCVTNANLGAIPHDRESICDEPTCQLTLNLDYAHHRSMSTSIWFQQLRNRQLFLNDDFAPGGSCTR